MIQFTLLNSEKKFTICENMHLLSSSLPLLGGWFSAAPIQGPGQRPSSIEFWAVMKYRIGVSSSK